MHRVARCGSSPPPCRTNSVLAERWHGTVECKRETAEAEIQRSPNPRDSQLRRPQSRTLCPLQGCADAVEAVEVAAEAKRRRSLGLFLGEDTCGGRRGAWTSGSGWGIGEADDVPEPTVCKVGQAR